VIALAHVPPTEIEQVVVEAIDKAVERRIRGSAVHHIGELGGNRLVAPELELRSFHFYSGPQRHS